MNVRQCLILGKEKAAPAGAAEEEQSVRSQRPRLHFRTPDRRLYTRIAAYLRQQARRTTRRAARRPPALEAAA